MDEATSGGWNASKKRKRFLIATVTEGYGNALHNARVRSVWMGSHGNGLFWFSSLTSGGRIR